MHPAMIGISIDSRLLIHGAGKSSKPPQYVLRPAFRTICDQASMTRKPIKRRSVSSIAARSFSPCCGHYGPIPDSASQTASVSHRSCSNVRSHLNVNCPTRRSRQSVVESHDNWQASVASLRLLYPPCTKARTPQNLGSNRRRFESTLMGRKYALLQMTTLPPDRSTIVWMQRIR